MRRTRGDAHWSVDKKVPVALIVTLIIQTGGFIWWTSALNERVKTLETLSATAPMQADRLTRVEVQVTTMQRDVTEIKSDIKTIINKRNTR